MSNVILLVSGDNLPNVQILLKNEATGKPLNMSAAANAGVAPTLVVKMRAAGTHAVLAQLPANFVTDGSDGLVQFAFAGASLQVQPGMYEFEIDINWNGNKQTVYDLLRARVRAPF